MKRLTPEDKKLWRAVTKDARPLRLRIEKAEDEIPAPAQKPAKAKPVPLPPAPPLMNKKPPQGREVDDRTMMRFKRGQMAIDGTLDLHGYRLADAETEVAGFIKLKHGQGARCLLIIHGRGLLTGQAKIKKALPDWLSGLSGVVLAHATAQPKHGGQGASYILLRRKRVTKKT